MRSLLSRAEDLPLSQGQQHRSISQHSRTYPHRSRITQLLRYPSVQQGMQLPLTFPQSMLGPKSVHTRFIHSTLRTRWYCALTRDTSVPMSCGLI